MASLDFAPRGDIRSVSIVFRKGAMVLGIRGLWPLSRRGPWRMKSIRLELVSPKGTCASRACRRDFELTFEDAIDPALLDMIGRSTVGDSGAWLWVVVAIEAERG